MSDEEHISSISEDSADSADDYEKRLMTEALLQFQEFCRLGCTPVAAATGVLMRGTIPQLAPIVTGLVADGWTAKRIRKSLLPRLGDCIDEAVREAQESRARAKSEGPQSQGTSERSK